MRAACKLVATFAAAVWLTAATAWAQQPIRPNEPFGGVVNGNTELAQVLVVCQARSLRGRTGPPAGNQSLMVVLGHLGGFTGSASSVVAAFREDPSKQVVFTEYGVPQPVPSPLKLPCDGVGGGDLHAPFYNGRHNRRGGRGPGQVREHRAVRNALAVRPAWRR